MAKAQKLRVLIAEDDAHVRAATIELIESEREFELVGVAADATEAISLAETQQPDVVLLDVRMPGGGGQAAAKGIRRCSPDSRMIALSGHDDRAAVLKMLECGAIGFLVKGGPIQEIIDGIKSAAKGQGSLSPSVTADVIDVLADQLQLRVRTQRQRRIRETRIRNAVDDDDAFSMAFQPIVALGGGKVVGAEALARFRGPPKRTPDVWFAEAAEMGLAESLELAAVRKALDGMQDLPRNVYLTVNVSPGSLASAEFHELVSDVGGDGLVAEITEHALVEDYDQLVPLVRKLRRLGMRVAVDDVGAGFASLRHILNLGPDLLKLDISLITGIHRDLSKQALVASLVTFADKTGAAIIAEGIECAAEVRTLGELGVAYGQGYFLGRPAPLPLTPTAAPASLVALTR